MKSRGIYFNHSRHHTFQGHNLFNGANEPGLITLSVEAEMLQNESDLNQAVTNHVLDVKRGNWVPVINHVQGASSMSVLNDFEARAEIFGHWPIVGNTVHKVRGPV